MFYIQPQMLSDESRSQLCAEPFVIKWKERNVFLVLYPAHQKIDMTANEVFSGIELAHIRVFFQASFYPNESETNTFSA